MTLKGNRTVPELIANATTAYGSSLALKMRGGLGLEKYTYAELNEQVARMEHLLCERGIAKGDRVLLWANNSPSWVIAFLGILGMGAVAVPLDVRSTPEFAQKVTAQTEARLALVGRTTIPEWVDHLLLDELPLRLHDQSPQAVSSVVQPGDLAEIMFTSGTTGTPKGVMLTHCNLVSNVEMALSLMPLRAGLRALSFLPLSHVFEQIVGLLVPLVSGVEVVYLVSRQPNMLLQALHRERIQAMALVPQALALLMRNIERELESRGLGQVWRAYHRLAPHLPIRVRRVLSYPVRRSLGAQLEFVLSGGAALPIEIAQKWENLGIPILEGYGATEATALVTGNGLEVRRLGTIGKPVRGIDLRIEDDGEILIRGESIFASYWQNPQATQEAKSDGWYQTGDLGEKDDAGFIRFRGRKKNLIVLANGMKVHAEDVEDALQGREGIRDVVVVGLPKDDQVQVHAVVLPSTGDDEAVRRAIREANQRLAPHQQIQGLTIWKGEDFPRTLALKVKRFEIIRQLEEGQATAAPAPSTSAARSVESLLAEIAHVPVEKLQPTMQLGRDLGLDSLSLVELALLLEEQRGVRLDEQQLNAQLTIGELEALVDRGAVSAGPPYRFAFWPLNPLAAALRELLQGIVVRPLLATYAPLQVYGAERLEHVGSPCFMICNHTSHLDSFVILRALPRAMRRRVAVAAAADYWFQNPLLAFAAPLFYNAYPMVRSGAVRPSLEHSVELLDRGWSVLIFPEGTRSPDGHLQSFHSGIGLLASETGVPVVPLKIIGTHEILPKGRRYPRRGKVKVIVGEPVAYPVGSDSGEVTHDLEERVDKLEA